MANVNFSLPALSAFEDGADSRQTRQMRAYLYQLTDQLRFVLANLDTENFVVKVAQKIDSAADADDVTQKIESAVVKGESDFKEALAQIADSASAVTAAYAAALNVLEQSIRSDVSATYALKSDVASGLYAVSTQVDQQATSITATLSRVLSLENAVGGFTETAFSNYIRFDSEGIELGRSDSDFKARLTNAKLSFLQGSSEIAYVSNNKLYITDANVTGRLSIGSAATGYYDWRAESNGSLSLTYRQGV